MVVEEKKTWGQSRSLYLGGSAVLSEDPKIWGVGRHKEVSLYLNGKVLLKYGVKGSEPALGLTGVAGSVLRVSKVAARRRQLWRSGDGGVG